MVIFIQFMCIAMCVLFLSVYMFIQSLALPDHIHRFSFICKIAFACTISYNQSLNTLAISYDKLPVYIFPYTFSVCNRKRFLADTFCYKCNVCVRTPN